MDRTVQVAAVFFIWCEGFLLGQLPLDAAPPIVLHYGDCFSELRIGKSRPRRTRRARRRSKSVFTL